MRFTTVRPAGAAHSSVPERTEYEQQIEALQDGKRALYERYLMGEIDLNTYKAEKAACDELLLKTKNAYAAVLAQAKQKQDEQVPLPFRPVRPEINLSSYEVLI